MEYPKYNNNNSWKSGSKPKPRNNYDGAASSSDDYQRFLEYLENAGQAHSFRKKIINAHLFKKKDG